VLFVAAAGQQAVELMPLSQYASNEYMHVMLRSDLLSFLLLSALASLSTEPSLAVQ
jgi:hypothetical protein